jgi:hypothetical protein
MKVYFNDQQEKTSRLVNMGDVPEIAGISTEQFESEYDSDLEKLNGELYLISFTEEPEFDVI